MTGDKLLKVFTYLLTIATVINACIMYYCLYFRPNEAFYFSFNKMNVILPSVSTGLSFINMRYTKQKWIECYFG